MGYGLADIYEVTGLNSEPRLGYTRFWQTILYQYYTGQNIYYTILYLYQYYTNFLEWFPGMQWIHSTWENPFENEKGVKTLSYHTQHKLMFERYAKNNIHDFTCLIL